MSNIDDGLFWAERMHEEYGSWDYEVWAERGF